MSFNKEGKGDNLVLFSVFALQIKGDSLSENGQTFADVTWAPRNFLTNVLDGLFVKDAIFVFIDSLFDNFLYFEAAVLFEDNSLIAHPGEDFST